MVSQDALIGGELRIGIAGAGIFGGYHAQKYHHHEAAYIACVYDKDEQTAIEFAQKFQCDHSLHYEDFLARVDAVIITVPAQYHGALAIAALKNKKHVFVEKPIALSLDDANEMINLAHINNVSLQVGHQERYVVDAMGLFSLPEKPLSIECRRCMPATGRGEDVSVVMDLMIHDLDIIAQYSDLKMPNVQINKNMCGDHKACATLLFEEGNEALKVTLVADRRHTEQERSMLLCFDQGEIYLDFLKREIRNTTPYPLKGSFQLIESEHVSIDNLALSDPLAFGADHFLNSIKGSKPPLINGADGALALQWGLEIEKKIHYAYRPNSMPIALSQEAMS